MKRFLCVLLVLALLPLAAIPALAAPVMPDTSAPSVLLMEKETGKILYEKEADKKLTPASVTKIMTLLLVMEALERGSLRLDEQVTVSRNAQGMGGSQVYLAEGEKYTVNELIKAAAIASGNDAAVALAEHLAGSEETFVGRMNERAVELGMTNTTFLDCTGLSDAGHLTTARDIAIMSRQMMLYHPAIKEYTTIWRDTLRNGTFGLDNTNRLIRFYDGATGLKTGSTSTAKFCVSATAERDGMELIAVIMAADSSDKRWDDARTLLDYGFANYKLMASYPEEVMLPVPVILGVKDEVQPELLDSRRILVEKTLANSLVKETTLAENVHAPVEKGQTLGELTIKAGDEVLANVPIVASEAVAKLTFWQILGQMFGVLFVK